MIVGRDGDVDLGIARKERRRMICVRAGLNVRFHRVGGWSGGSYIRETKNRKEGGKDKRHKLGRLRR